MNQIFKNISAEPRMKILFSGSFGADAAYGAQLDVRENIDDGDLVVVAVPTHTCAMNTYGIHLCRVEACESCIGCIMRDGAGCLYRNACMGHSRKRNVIVEQELIFEDVKYEKAMEIMADMKRNEKK